MDQCRRRLGRQRFRADRLARSRLGTLDFGEENGHPALEGADRNLTRVGDPARHDYCQCTGGGCRPRGGGVGGGSERWWGGGAVVGGGLLRDRTEREGGGGGGGR